MSAGQLRPITAWAKRQRVARLCREIVAAALDIAETNLDGRTFLPSSLQKRRATYARKRLFRDAEDLRLVLKRPVIPTRRERLLKDVR